MGSGKQTVYSFEQKEGLYMSTLTENLFKEVETCPWCGSRARKVLYVNEYSTNALECKDCGFVYSSKILTKDGAFEYWKNYASQVHTADDAAVEHRQLMYDLEYNFVARLIECSGKSILDVGCGEGDFLKRFERGGADCYGIEYGKEAAEIASKYFVVWQGEFPDMDIAKAFDLIIFRGSIQYCINPKRYLEKAVSLLNTNGLLYITSSPNARSLCFRLFKENFTLPVGVTECYGFSEPLLTEYMQTLNMRLVVSHYFYEEGPYADLENDILKVSKAIEYTRQNKPVDFQSPAFYDNMLTLVYKKC